MITKDWTERPIELPPTRTWPAAAHRLKPDTAAALRAAEATGRPLLIRGLPGVGKSMTARAAAHLMARPILSQVIDARTEPDDLKARFDAVRRLADAQARGPRSKALPPESAYLNPQVLWWAFDWPSAQAQRAQYLQRQGPAGKAAVAGQDYAWLPAEHPPDWNPATDRSVLLLDEIDKADPELPNALLEAFGSAGFTVPLTGQPIVCPPQRRPLIILTTNEERELPPAFLRRCMVLWLALPEAHGELVNELEQIGNDHQHWLAQPGSGHGKPQRTRQCLVIREAAEAVAAVRLATPEGEYMPGTSEFLDLVTALAELWPDDKAEQQRKLDEVAQFTLHKQARPPAA